MKIEKCPFCGKDVAEISNCQELEGCRHFEKCPATEPYVCVVCNMHEGGCGASSGYYDSAEKAIAAWNRRAGKDINVATNADRIRSMSDEELAWFINLSPEMEFEVCLYCANGNTVPDDRGICLRPRGVCVANDRRDAFLDWLKQPVKEESQCPNT